MAQELPTALSCVSPSGAFALKWQQFVIEIIFLPCLL
jgi:hypothetical protein